MVLRIVQVAGAALWIVVALSSPRIMAADTAIKIGSLSMVHSAPKQLPKH